MNSSADQPKFEFVLDDETDATASANESGHVAAERDRDAAGKVKAPDASAPDVIADAAKPETAKTGSSRSDAIKTPVASREISISANHPAKDEVSPKKKIEPIPPKPTPGSALITLGPSAEHFDPRDGAASAERTAPRFGKNDLFAYGSRAAVIAFLLGCGYLASGQFFRANSHIAPEHLAQTPAHLVQASVPANVTAPEPAERAEFRRVTQEMSDEIRTLKSSLASLRSSVAQSQTADEIRTLKKSLDSAKSALEANKAEAATSIAQLTAKLEHLQHEQAAKLQQALEKAEHAEQRANNIPLTTASIPAPVQTPAQVRAPVQVANTNALASPKLQSPAPAQTNAADQQKKIQAPLAKWVLRDVYDGIAFVEGPGGGYEVMQGENIPGVGVVKSIERRGNGWVVVTNRGNVEYARE